MENKDIIKWLNKNRPCISMTCNKENADSINAATNMAIKAISNVELIKDIIKNILIKNDVDGYRPIKDTSKKDCYNALYEIQELLRRSEQCHGGLTHD